MKYFLKNEEREVDEEEWEDLKNRLNTSDLLSCSNRYYYTNIKK